MEEEGEKGEDEEEENEEEEKTHRPYIIITIIKTKQIIFLLKINVYINKDDVYEYVNTFIILNL
jgi:hypothetical protein